MDRKRGREDADELACDVSEAKRFNGLTAQGEELLHLLEDMEDPCDEKSLEDSEELVNGVIRSLEEEIGVQPTCSHSRLNENIQLEDLPLSESVNRLDANFELGYLLEASDDELGIPPTDLGSRLPEDQSSSDESCADILDSPAVENENEYYGDQLWQFEDEVSGYDMLDFGYCCDVNRFNEAEGRDFAALFEHSDVDQSWRQEATCGI